MIYEIALLTFGWEGFVLIVAELVAHILADLLVAVADDEKYDRSPERRDDPEYEHPSQRITASFTGHFSWETDVEEP